MMSVTERGKTYIFQTFEEYAKWDEERCRKIKEEKEAKWKAEREAKLAKLTEEDYKKIEELERDIWYIKMGTDFLSFEERQLIDKLNRQIREIRGF